MQKFTVFSIILSCSVLLMIGDVLFNGYLGRQEAAVEDAPVIEVETVIPEETSVDDSSETPDSTDDSTEPPSDEVSAEGLVDQEVDLTSESFDLDILTPQMDENAFLSAGFFDPTLKDTIYSGYLFQFLPFSDVNAFVYQWNLFDGETYVGSVYEVKYPNETASFQAYLALRQAGSNSSDLGAINEVNNYGDASFYFNHLTKTQTVHLVIRSGDTVYAFEYAHRNHETMKNIFESL